MDDEQGVIQFLTPVGNAATIVVTGISRGMPFERIIALGVQSLYGLHSAVLQGAVHKGTALHHLERYDGLNVFSELKWRVKNIDFKLAPEFTRNQCATQQGNSMHLRTDISSVKLRLFS